MKIRKVQTFNKMQHPKAGTRRLYLLKLLGGRDLIQFKISYKTTKTGLAKYFDTSYELMLNIFDICEIRNDLHFVMEECIISLLSELVKLQLQICVSSYKQM